MGRDVAITVAVGAVTGGVAGARFPPLPGAYGGAAEFADWAAAQGFTVLRHTDEARPVTLSALFVEVKELVTAGGVRRLFLYFAGHGINLGGGDDVWLLSGALENPNDAVNVARSVHDARRCGIPHLAFFADACRTAAPPALLNVRGGSLFPVRQDRPRVKVDQFYATRSGDPAWERRPDDPQIPPYGIFSRCLMPALRGEVGEVVQPVAGGDAPRAVLAEPLAAYLDWAVPSLALEEVAREQVPDLLNSSSWEPDVLAWVPDRAREAPDPFEPPAPPPEPPRRQPAPLADAPGFVAEVAANLETVGRANFETRTGLSVPHEILLSARVAGGDEGVFEEAGTWHVRGRHHTPAAALLELAPGAGGTRWAASAMLPGFIGTLRVSPAGTEQTAYLPAPGTPAELGAAGTADAVAHAAAAARRGRLDLADPLIETACWTDLNPTVVLLAAYARERAGDAATVRELAVRFAQRHGLLLFDLALLAAEDVAGGVPVVPGYPLMTRGWHLLDEPPGGPLEAARAHLTAAPWTGFVGIDEPAVAGLTG